MIINRFISTAHIDIKHSARRYWRQLSIVLLICTLLLSWSLTGFAPFGRKVSVVHASIISGSSLATSVTLGTLRNNYTGQVGMEFTTGSSALTVTALGRIYVSGNTGAHTVYLYDSSKVLITSVSVNTANGVADQLGFKYTALPKPLTLAASTSYYLVSGETSGGDSWYDDPSTTMTLAAGVTLNISVYGPSGPSNTHTAGHTYVPVNLLTASSNLTQRHYIFQQDNGANVNSNSNNGTADTALTGVKRGERLLARFQIDNTDAANNYTGRMGLFYDRNDGIWTQVSPAGTGPTTVGSGNCTSTTYDCNTIDSLAANTGNYTSIAIANDNKPWVSYQDGTNSNLRVAQYVGGGGNCSSGLWNCTNVDAAGAGSTAIGFDPGGTAWIAYWSGSALRVAKYVGNAGTGCTGSAAWTCTTIDSSAANVGQYAAISFDLPGNAWISYYDATNTRLKVASYVGTGGTCTSTAWNCSVVDAPASTNVGSFGDIAVDRMSSAWIAYTDSTNGAVKVAQYVGSGGTGCANGTNNAAWNCMTVQTGTGSNANSRHSVAIDPNDTAWLAFGANAGPLTVAKYVSTGGTGCTSAAWSCTTVASGSNGFYTSMAFDATGTPWTTYTSGGTNPAALAVARMVGSGGNCTSTAWNCTTVDSSSTVTGYYSSLAFDSDGTAWISYQDNSNHTLKVANIKRGGEISWAYGLSGSNGDALTAAAAGTCTTGTTFSNGAWQEGANISSVLNINASKCTEVSFAIDTSQASDGTTYRLALRDMTGEQGLNTYSVYPTFTIISAGSDIIRASKDVIDRLGAPTSCTNSAWDCMVADGYNSATSVYDGRYNGLAFDSAGRPWISSEDNQNKRLVVSQYTPGSAASGQCSANWTCTVVMSDGGTTEYGVGTTMTFDQAGTAWVSFQDYTHKYLYVAQYVGTGGYGCGSAGSTAWICTKVDGSGNVGSDTDISVDKFGNPWIAYANYTSGYLLVAHYNPGAPSSGSCAGGWVCETVGTGNNGSRARIIFDTNDVPYIAYNNFSASTVEIASLSKTYGSACSGTNASWYCASIASSSGTVEVDIALDSANVPYISYFDATNTSLDVAKYVGGTSGTGCTNTAWTCTIVDNNIGGSTNTGHYSSLTFSPEGTLYASYSDQTTTGLKIATNDGNGSGTCTSTAWNCSIIDKTSASMGDFTTIRFDESGVPWVAYQDATNGDSKIAKLVIPVSHSQLRYKLDNLGYSYIANNDSNLDPLAATSYTPMYHFDAVGQTNTRNIQPTWVGQSTVAASTDNIILQIWRGGTTNAWVTMTTNTTCTASTSCTITPTAITTSLSDYYQASGSQYIVQFRLYQAAGSSQTLSTNYFNMPFNSLGPTLDQLLRHGTWFNNGAKQPMTF